MYPESRLFLSLIRDTHTLECKPALRGFIMSFCVCLYSVLLILPCGLMHTAALYWVHRYKHTLIIDLQGSGMGILTGKKKRMVQVR